MSLSGRADKGRRHVAPAKDSLSIPAYLQGMARFPVFFARLAVLASAGAVLFFCTHARAQGAGAGFEAAPGSQMITSTGQPVIAVGPATPSAGVAAQPSYGGFPDAPPGMYAAPMGYGAGAS